jgi:hypothetical protein
MRIKDHNHNKQLNTLTITFFLVLGLGSCMPALSSLSKEKNKAPVALNVDRSPGLKYLLAQEQQRFEEIDALIKTMSLEELVVIVMLDVEDSEDHRTPIAERAARIAEKTAHMHQILDALTLKEARARVSKSLIEDCLHNWKHREIDFILCKCMNAGEKLKTATNDKVRRYIELYRVVLKGYMSQHRYKQY